MIDKKLLDRVITVVKKHEGYRQFPYKCTADKLTIGIGRNLDANGISENEAVGLLMNDLNSWVIPSLKSKFRDWDNFSDNRKIALIDMMFNLGLPRFNKFVKMIDAINKYNWILASKEALNSKWATQVGSRANDVSDMIRKG